MHRLLSDIKFVAALKSLTYFVTPHSTISEGFRCQFVLIAFVTRFGVLYTGKLNNNSALVASILF